MTPPAAGREGQARPARQRLGRAGRAVAAHLLTFAVAAGIGLAAYGAVLVLVRLERVLLD